MTRVEVAVISLADILQAAFGLGFRVMFSCSQLQGPVILGLPSMTSRHCLSMSFGSPSSVHHAPH